MPAPIVQRHYETVILIRPDASDTQQNEVRERIQNIIETDGRVARWETWGKRKLAYEVQKQNKAWYLYSSYVTTQPNIAEMERNMRIMESVMLFQTVRLSDEVTLDTFDFEAEAQKRTPLFMTPEEAAAKEASYQREQEWAAGPSRDDAHDGSEDNSDDAGSDDSEEMADAQVEGENS